MTMMLGDVALTGLGISCRSRLKSESAYRRAQVCVLTDDRACGHFHTFSRDTPCKDTAAWMPKLKNWRLLLCLPVWR
jgi:hypothetical protein